MQINRPTAGSYTALEKERKTLSGKADSVFAYRANNPYSVAFDKFKREKNANMNADLWQKAANKGELDQYINLLLQNDRPSAKLAELTEKYGARVDYDTTMLALSYDAVQDDAKEERFDSAGNSIGSYTQRELIDRVLEQQALRWDAEILEDAKRSDNFFKNIWLKTKTFGVESYAFILKLGSGGTRVFNDAQDTFAGGLHVISQTVDGRVKNFEDISKAYTDGATGNTMPEWAKDRVKSPDSPFGFLGEADDYIDNLDEELSRMAFDVKRKYSTSVNAVTGEVTWWGKILDGMADSIGYMSLAMISGNPLGMYMPMFTGNVKENVALYGPNVNYSKIMTNAATKAGVEYAIEWGLGKALGFTQLDKLIGFGDDALRVGQQTVTKSLTATTKQAVGQVALSLGKDMLKEGFEEVLQEASGMFIDYLYADDFRLRANENFTLENFTQAFTVGMATSLAIGNFSNLTVHRATGIDEAGLTYKMGIFKSVVYNKAVATMNAWQQTAVDPKANPADRITAALKLEGVVATLGNLYATIGAENAVKAEKLLLSIQAYHEKRASIKEQVSKKTYLSGLLTNLDNEVGGKTWTTAFNDVTKASADLLGSIALTEVARKSSKTPVAFKAFKAALSNLSVQAKLAASGVETIDPVDITGETAPDTIYETAQKAGFNLVVKTDGKDIIVADDVIFIPDSLLDTDTQTLLKEVATQKTIQNIIANIPAELLVNVINTFSKTIGDASTKYEDGKLQELAIAALMFDKNFQLKMLLETHQNNATWGTTNVINFIRNLKKMIAKTYVKSDTEVTESGKPKRVLSNITNAITERVVSSLQASIVIMESNYQRSTTYNKDTNQVELAPEIKQVLSTDSITEITTNKNVWLSSVLDALKSGKIVITPAIDTFLTETSQLIVANQYTKLNKIITNKDNATAADIKANMLNILNGTSNNARLDLIGLLTNELYASSLFAKNKVKYIALDKSNMREHIAGKDAKLDIEKRLLNNQSLEAVLKGTADLENIAPEILAYSDEFQTNESIRFMILDTIVKHTTLNEFVLLPNGTIAKAVRDMSVLKSSLQQAMTDNTLFDFLSNLRSSKADRIIRLQDLFEIKLSKTIGQIPLAITWTTNIAGYYQHGGLIHVQLNEALSAGSITTILHEMIHATIDASLTDIRYNTVGGGIDSIKAQLKQAMKIPGNEKLIDELTNYITSNFPLHTKLLAGRTDLTTAGAIVYRLLSDEVQARSVGYLDVLTFGGFTYQLVNNIIYLVAPDNITKWPIRESAPERISNLSTMKLNVLTVKLPQLETTQAKIRELLAAESIEEFQAIYMDWASQVKELATFAKMNYDDIILPTSAYNKATDTVTEVPDTGFIFNEILKQFPEVTRVSLTRILLKFKSTATIRHFSKNETIFSVATKLPELIRDLEQMLSNVRDERQTGIIPVEAVDEIVTMFYDNVLIPLYNMRVITDIYHTLGKSFQSKPFEAPKSFNFGDYSFTKHTGRSYMLTHKVGNRFNTQEVAMDTLLPVRANQKPLLEDATLRDKMLFVIAKKIEVAKSTLNEPVIKQGNLDTEAGQKASAKAEAEAKNIVFSWGPWLVKNYDKDHYIISKDSDKTGTDEGARYNQIQIVSKKTLLPETMLGAVGKPILSATERNNLLDWIEHNTAPEAYKVKDEDPTKERWIYKSNLSDKSKTEAELKAEFEEEIEGNDLFEHIPGNMSLNYKDGTAFAKQVAKFYKKYPALREWVEGNTAKTEDQLLTARQSKEAGLALLYKELYQNTYKLTGTYAEFLKTPIYFVRTMTTNKVKLQSMNSVSLGYDLTKLPVFGDKTDYVYFGTLLPSELITYLPLSYAEGLTAPEIFSKNPPVSYTQFEEFVERQSNDIVTSEFQAPEFDNEGVKLTEAQSKFFKNSVVKDEDGNLLRVYHGTKDDFTIFKHIKTANTKAYGNGFYFTSSLDDATGFAGKNGKVLATYLNITNPIDFGDWQPKVVQAKIRETLKLSEDTPITDQHINSFYDTLRKTENKDGLVIKSNSPFLTDIYVAFDSNQIKLVHNNTPTNELAIDAFEPPNVPRRKYISNARAAKSNLSYFRKKGKPIQMHSDVAAFVEGTTTDFDKLSKFFQTRIKNGTLNYHAIMTYIGTVKVDTINEFTWKAIAKYIYGNEALANLGPTFVKFFLDKDRLETYAVIARMTEDEAILQQTNNMVGFKKLENAFNEAIKVGDPAFIKKYKKVKKSLESWWTYTAEGRLENMGYIIDEKQLLPIFMRHFDGTIKSLNTIFTLAKVLAGKQSLQTLSDNSGATTADDTGGKATKVSSNNSAIEDNTTGVKSTGSRVYKWLDNFRQNVIDYEVADSSPETTDDTKTFEDLDADQKYNIIYDYLYTEALNYTKSPTQQEQYEADQEVTETLENMTVDEVDKAVQYILENARKAISIRQVIVTKPVTDTLKIIKDQLRNRTRSLIQKLAGSKVAYNNLDPALKELIEFTPTSSRINTEAYTNLSEAELIALSDKVADEINRIKVAQQRAKDLEKTRAIIARKVAALQKRERDLAEKTTRVKAREKAIKEGKNLKGKINVAYDTKVDKQAFTITGPSQINNKLLAILNHTWNKTVTSKVKYMNDSVQTIQNKHIAEEFYKAHADELGTMTLAEIEDVTEWLIGATLSNADGVASQTFEATRFFILAYIYNETAGQFARMNDNLKQELANFLKSVQTNAGTLLSLVKQVKDKLNPTAIISSELFSRFEYKISDAEQTQLDQAFAKGDVVEITKLLHTVKQNALANLVPEKVSALRKVAAIRSMSMTSSPMTWLRNIISNFALEHLNPLATKLGNVFFPKLNATTQNTATQYKLTEQITPEIQQFITEQFIESGFFDETIDQLSKYNPSQILRHKKAGEVDIIGDMLIHSIYNHFYSESMFNSKLLNNIHTFLMKRLSDKNWVRRASVKYLGKLLAETKHHLDDNGNVKTTIDKTILTDVANAFALATTDYMHSDNFFSHIEKWLTQHSQVGWAFYKTIMPFATASWNWFKAAMRYSPVGLGRAIVQLSKLEQQIIARETEWDKGESQIDPALTTYMVRRDLGSGIIGTISLGFGAILAALGYISLEDDDWGTPKLAIGNLRIDISSIFGSSSVLAGAAFIKTMQDKDLTSALDAMLDPLVDGFFFTDLLQMDANSPKGWFEWGKYQAESILLSFIPSFVRYVSGMTYTGTYRTNNVFQKAVTRLPFLGQAFNVPKKTNIYTGDTEGTFWDIAHRLFPYFEIVTKSQAQEQTEMYGLNKEELNGTYRINGESFKTKPSETARINKLYGKLNADDLTDFYSNKATYRVLSDNNRYISKTYSQMTTKEIQNALDQIFSANSNTAKISAWLAAGHTYYTNDAELMRTLRSLGYTKVYLGNKGFVK